MAIGRWGVVPDGEIVPLQELRDGEVGCESYHLGEVEFPEPLALPHHLGAHLVNQCEELAHVRFGVRLYLLVGEHGTRHRLSAGVAYLRRPVADDQDDLMPQLLELAQFAQSDDMSQVDVGPTGVEPHLQSQGLFSLHELVEFTLDDHLDYPSALDMLQSGIIDHWRSPLRTARDCSTSCFICCTSASTLEKASSPLRRCSNSKVMRLP